MLIGCPACGVAIALYAVLVTSTESPGIRIDAYCGSCGASVIQALACDACETVNVFNTEMPPGHDRDHCGSCGRAAKQRQPYTV